VNNFFAEFSYNFYSQQGGVTAASVLSETSDMLRCMQSSESNSQYDLKILAKMRRLYPHASQEQLLKGKFALERFVDIAWKIAERLERQSSGIAFDSTSENS